MSIITAIILIGIISITIFCTSTAIVTTIVILLLLLLLHFLSKCPATLLGFRVCWFVVVMGSLFGISCDCFEKPTCCTSDAWFPFEL